MLQASIPIRSCFVPAPAPAPARFTGGCASCNLRGLCLPGALGEEDMQRVERIVYTRKRVRRGEALFNPGDEFSAVYAVRSGLFKCVVLDREAREQVTGFLMGGELIGLDGLSGRHNGAATALEDSEVCILPYALIEEMSRDLPTLQRQLHAVLAREIVREQQLLLMLGTMRSGERLAAFLLNLSQRLRRRGYSGSDIRLRMTREELGSHLGLTCETVSRLLSQFHDERLVEVRHRRLRILDLAGLERMLSHRH